MSFFHINLHSYTIMLKQKKKSFNNFANLLKIKNLKDSIA